MGCFRELVWNWWNCSGFIQRLFCLGTSSYYIGIYFWELSDWISAKYKLVYITDLKSRIESKVLTKKFSSKFISGLSQIIMSKNEW